VAKALLYKGTRLAELGRGEEAVAAYDDVVLRIGEDPDRTEQVAWAMVNKGVRLAELGRGDEAVGVYDEVVERFGEDPDPAVRGQVAWALVNKGMTLGGLGAAPGLPTADTTAAPPKQAPRRTRTPR
jgi:tetratricopeptide (TPR) repeat protein